MISHVIHQPRVGAITAQDLYFAQANAKKVLDVLTRFPLNDGVVIENVSLVAGVENLVPHGFGAKFFTWWPCDLKGPANVYRYDASTADLAIFVPVLTTADVVCDIVVIR